MGTPSVMVGHEGPGLGFGALAAARNCVLAAVSGSTSCSRKIQPLAGVCCCTHTHREVQSAEVVQSVVTRKILPTPITRYCKGSL